MRQVMTVRKPTLAAEEMPAGEAAGRADLATTDLESLTGEELRPLIIMRRVQRSRDASGERRAS